MDAKQLNCCADMAFCIFSTNEKTIITSLEAFQIFKTIVDRLLLAFRLWVYVSYSLSRRENPIKDKEAYIVLY